MKQRKSINEVRKQLYFFILIKNHKLRVSRRILTSDFFKNLTVFKRKRIRNLSDHIFHFCVKWRFSSQDVVNLLKLSRFGSSFESPESNNYSLKSLVGLLKLFWFRSGFEYPEANNYSLKSLVSLLKLFNFGSRFESS